MKNLFVILFFVLAFSTTLSAQGKKPIGASPVQQIRLDKNGFGFLPPAKLSPNKKLTLWATFYYVHEAPFDDSGIPLIDPDGHQTGAKLKSCDWCDAAVEGTVYTTDKNGKKITLNYANTGPEQAVDCDASCYKYRNYKNKKVGYSLWVPAGGEFGDGVSGYKLVPYRTIAVDKSVFPIGTLIFIPDAVGVEIVLPDGSKSKHDGYFFAADMGGDIKGDHIDVFLGLHGINPFSFVRSNSEKTFTAYQVKDSQVEQALTSIHKN